MQGLFRRGISTEIECSIATLEEDEGDLPLSEWVWRIDSVNFASRDLDGFYGVVDGILTTEVLTAEDIVMEVKNQQNGTSNEKYLQEEEDSENKKLK